MWIFWVERSLLTGKVMRCVYRQHFLLKGLILRWGILFTLIFCVLVIPVCLRVFSFQYLSLCDIRFWECNLCEQSMLCLKGLSRRKVCVGFMWWLDPVRTGWTVLHCAVVTEVFGNLSSLLPHLLVFTVSPHFFTCWQVCVEVCLKRFWLVFLML